MTGSTRALTEAEIRRVRSRMREIVALEGTQIAAARKIKISQQVYSRVLAGDAVGLYVAKKVAAYDKVPVDQLLEGAPMALESVIRSHPKRWSEPTIAFVRKAAMTEIAHPESRSDAEWIALLDRAETLLKPIVKDATARPTK